MKNLKTIGREDVVDLPDFGLKNVCAKIDTGAYTSSIHCKKIKVEDGVLQFIIPLSGGVKVVKEKYVIRKIRSSNGKAEKRYVVKSNIELFGKVYKIDFSLSNRSKMKNPVLIGRKFLVEKFLVDVSKKGLSQSNKQSE